MPDRLAVIGAPSSAGAYAPGQEKAPDALRAAGLIDLFNARGIAVDDRGNVPGFRWRADRANPRAMNASTVATVARATAEHVAQALHENLGVLVLGGDCTVELGTVNGALSRQGNVGLVYIDHDTDLNTPESTEDGALDWMGVAHLLDVDGTVPELVQLGSTTPMLRPDQILFFAHHNVEPFERHIIDQMGIQEVGLADVSGDPAQAAQQVVDGWARQFDHLLIHLDVDVLQFTDLPLAENVRRAPGLRFEQLMASLRPFLLAPNWTALTITEVNPDHGERDGWTLRTFADGLADAFSPSPH